jgi:predicted AlkP superfamily phosphohydrolase/phosphomutase
VESRIRFGRIDLAGTRAFSEETPHFPSIWIHVKGRDPLGTVAPGAEYESVRARIVERLLALRDPETGRPVVARALRREEAWSGPHVGSAPDVVVEYAPDAEGYTRQNGASGGRPGERAVSRVLPSDPDFPKFLLNKSGSHRPEGILALAGPGIRKGAHLPDAAIADVAPTLLHLLGQSLPGSLEGRVLEEALDPGLLARFPPRREEGPDAAVASRPASAEAPEPYTEGEAEEVRRRLQGLGYLE